MWLYFCFFKRGAGHKSGEGVKSHPMVLGATTWLLRRAILGEQIYFGMDFGVRVLASHVQGESTGGFVCLGGMSVTNRARYGFIRGGCYGTLVCLSAQLCCCQRGVSGKVL